MSTTLSVRGVTISRGPQLLIADATFTIAPGDRIGLVGPNGIGKSTLLAALAGDLPIDSGTLTLAPPNATVGWLRQEPTRAATSVIDALRERTGVTAAQRDLDLATTALADGVADAADQYDLAWQRWVALGAADFEARVGVVAADLGIVTRVLNQPTATLSGGEAARLGLAGLLLSRFDVYLLDEPTNDLDIDGLERLENWIIGLDGGLMVVSHDRTFLERVVTDVVEIDHHAHTITRFGGGWTAYRDERERSRRHAVERYEEYSTRRGELAKRAQRQREWAQQGRAKVRRSDESDKSIRHFRKVQTEQLAGKAAQTERAIERLEVVESPREPWELHLTVPDAERSGDIVARLIGATVERGTFNLGPVDLLVGYGDRIALSGANGAGKSTLIDLIIGRSEPTSGEVQRGSGLVIGEIEQTRQQLTAAATLLRSFSDATGLPVVESRTLLAKFGLVGPHVERPTASLSPGERTRATLALLQANGANLLVLDEPTNHLDLPAIEQLEQALDTFAGTILLVTHDRALLGRTRLTRQLMVTAGKIIETDPNR